MKLKSAFAIFSFCCGFLAMQTSLFAQECSDISSPSLQFSSQQSKLSSAMMQQLGALQSQMNANPDCKIVVSGNSGGSKLSQEVSWLRVDAIIATMSDQFNIARNRFIFQIGGTGPENAVDIRVAHPDESGPSTLVEPFPELRK